MEKIKDVPKMIAYKIPTILYKPLINFTKTSRQFI